MGPPERDHWTWLASVLAAISLTFSWAPPRSAEAQSVTSQVTPSDTPAPGPGVLTTGLAIVVESSMCFRIGQNDTCNGNDQSLSGYSIDFEIYAGSSPSGAPVDVITVTLDLGGGGRGKDVSDLLVGTTYTVCQVPLANAPNGGPPVGLDGVPKVTGSNESLVPGYPQCITLELADGGDSR